MLSGVKKNKIRVLAVNFAVRYRCINVVHTVHKNVCTKCTQILLALFNA